MLNPKQTQMYAIRLKPGTYPPPLAAGMYVAQSAVPSEIRFTPDIQVARTWGSYQETYSYLDENLYGIADVVSVVSMHSLLADINKLADNRATEGIPQLALDEIDKEPASSSYGSSSPEPDDTLHLYHLYHFSELPLLDGSPLAEEWATEAEVAQINEEAIPQGFIWVKAQD